MQHTHDTIINEQKLSSKAHDNIHGISGAVIDTPKTFKSTFLKY